MWLLIGQNQNPKDVNTEVRMIVIFHRCCQPISCLVFGDSQLSHLQNIFPPPTCSTEYDSLHPLLEAHDFTICIRFNFICILGIIDYVLFLEYNYTRQWNGKKKVKPERKKMSFQHRIVGHTFWRSYNYLGSKLERNRS